MQIRYSAELLVFEVLGNRKQLIIPPEIRGGTGDLVIHAHSAIN